jgi:hypothetical protein
MPLARALIAIGWLALAGTASAQPLADLSPAAIQQRVAVGDSVRATVKDGRAFDLTVVKVEAEALTGTTAENRRFRIRYSGLASLELRGKADVVEELGVAEKPRGEAVTVAPPKGSDNVRAWFGLGIGLVAGDVAVPCSDPGASGCSEGGVFTSFDLNITVAGPIAARLRAVHANEDTGHPPIEFAGLVGPRLGDDFYFLVGLSNVSHPDDDYRGDAKGVAWELLYAPRSLGSSIEISLHGATGDDLDYSGLSFGLRFGKLH